MGKFSKIFSQCCKPQNDNIEEENERSWNGAKIAENVATNPRLKIKVGKNSAEEIALQTSDENRKDVEVLLHIVIPNSKSPKKPNSSFVSW